MAILSVGPTSAFPTIAAAMAVAVPGDTIALEPGYSNEAALVGVDNLIFVGGASSNNIALVLAGSVVTATLEGSAPIAVFDNVGNNLITGNSGANNITVTQGIDVVDGGAGNDRLVADYTSTTLGLNVTLLTGSIDGHQGLLGDLANHVVSFDNIDSFDIRTGSGHDVITTGNGDDRIRVHAGIDVIIAGAGNDRLVVDYSDETSNVTSDPLLGDLLSGFLGGYSDGQLLGDSVSFTGIETFDITTGSGNDVIVTGAGDDRIVTNDGTDTLIAGGGNDVLDGGAGADSMSGGAGDDWYFVDHPLDTIVDAVGEGNADIVLARASYGLNPGAQIELLGFADTASTLALNLVGNEFANNIYGNQGANSLSGGAGNDRIFALGGLDTLYGNAGNDFLDGGLGDDIMAGGAHNDAYLVDSANDVVIEAVGEGTDQVFALVSYDLAPGVEVETLSAMNRMGTDAINLAGNEFANVIVGNAGVNTLIGDAGNDQLYGGDGDDTLNGGAGDDRMYGGLGVNYLIGGGGNDWYFIANSTDTINDGNGEGTLDRVFAGVDYTLGIGIEIEMMSTDDHTGTAAINLTGNELANVISGNAGANIINGKGGNDTLGGRDGADIFVFDTTPDSVTNRDFIVDFNPLADRIELAQSVFTSLTGGPGTALAASEFRIGAVAQDADDFIIYNPANGLLLYDVDGSGAGAAVQVAILTNAPTLGSGDFLLG